MTQNEKINCMGITIFFLFFLLAIVGAELYKLTHENHHHSPASQAAQTFCPRDCAFCGQEERTEKKGVP